MTRWPILGIVLFSIVGCASEEEDPVALTKARLVRLHQAVQLYRSDHDDALAAHGTAAQMYLPPLDAVTRGVLKATPIDFVAPCAEGRISKSPWHSTKFDYWPEVGHPTKMSDRSMLFSTLSCNLEIETVGAPFMAHRGIGIRLSGSLVDIRKEGEPANLQWWSADE